MICRSRLCGVAASAQATTVRQFSDPCPNPQPATRLWDGACLPPTGLTRAQSAGTGDGTYPR